MGVVCRSITASTASHHANKPIDEHGTFTVTCWRTMMMKPPQSQWRRRVVMPLLILLMALAIGLWSRSQKSQVADEHMSLLRIAVHNACDPESPKATLAWGWVLHSIFSSFIKDWCDAGIDVARISIQPGPGAGRFVIEATGHAAIQVSIDGESTPPRVIGIELLETVSNDVLPDSLS